MRGRAKGWILLAALAAGLGVLSAAAADLKVPPAPDHWVTDTAGFLSPDAAASLDARLSDYAARTGHQVLVYIGRTTGGVPIEDFAVKAFEAWKVGRKGLDDGLVLFIMADDRSIRIEVGYGLEDKVPDARAFRVINEILVPGIRAGNRDAAVASAVSSLLGLISGEPGAPGTEEPQGAPGRPFGRPISRGESIIRTVFIVAAAIFFLILFITHPTLALWLLFSIFSGGRGGGRGGGFGGGGGFSGGGGRSGGGGASGSW